MCVSGCFGKAEGGGVVVLKSPCLEGYCRIVGLDWPHAPRPPPPPSPRRSLALKHACLEGRGEGGPPLTEPKVNYPLTDTTDPYGGHIVCVESVCPVSYLVRDSVAIVGGLTSIQALLFLSRESFGCRNWFVLPFSRGYGEFGVPEYAATEVPPNTPPPAPKYFTMLLRAAPPTRPQDCGLSIGTSRLGCTPFATCLTHGQG